MSRRYASSFTCGCSHTEWATESPSEDSKVDIVQSKMLLWRPRLTTPFLLSASAGSSRGAPLLMISRRMRRASAVSHTVKRPGHTHACKPKGTCTAGCLASASSVVLVMRGCRTVDALSVRHLDQRLCEPPKDLDTHRVERTHRQPIVLRPCSTEPKSTRVRGTTWMTLGKPPRGSSKTMPHVTRSRQLSASEQHPCPTFINIQGSPSSASNRSLISPAALFVNVTARICHGFAPSCRAMVTRHKLELAIHACGPDVLIECISSPSRSRLCCYCMDVAGRALIRCAMRRVSTLVLPDPGPATTLSR